jgi:CDP-diacylglycerol--glycerol-3-phosphate 3-phosphatidyltransferase
MPSIYTFKPRFQDALRPWVKRLFAYGVTANQTTLAAATGSVLVGILVAALASHRWVFALVPVWMVMRMALNAMDGMLAREFGQQSALGAYLNELGDLLADSALILPFLLIPDVSLTLTLLTTLLAWLSEYAGVMGPMVGSTRRYDGPMGKSDRAFVLGALAIAIAVGWLDAGWINAVLSLMSALLCYTIFNRVRAGLTDVRKCSPLT